MAIQSYERASVELRIDAIDEMLESIRHEKWHAHAYVQRLMFEQRSLQRQLAERGIETGPSAS